MAREENDESGVSRREFLESAGVASLALGVGALAGLPSVSSAARGEGKAPGAGGGAGAYNILFILTDQERYFDPATLPGNYSLPGRERLRSEGVSFTNHQITTSVCSSSRSSIYTGQHIQHTKVFDNLGLPWAQDLSPEIPTVGKYLQAAGYHAAYLGKCHFINELEEIEIEDAPDVNMDELNKVMQRYGFDDFVGVGDIIGMMKGGYKTDEFTTSTAVRWLRAERSQLEQQGKPWFLALNLVNPHDVMFYNTDAAGASPVQGAGHLFPIEREPAHALYQGSWDLPLSASRNEGWGRAGRLNAHREYHDAQRVLLGEIPNEDPRWKRMQDYYLNCIADCDRHVARVLQELDDLGIAESTIVVMTSDHGELAGAHGLTGKGATSYKEQVHVPLWIRHPGHATSAGKECAALTSHLDLTPTILGLAGVGSSQLRFKAPVLKGHDVSELLASPTTAKANAVREVALYNYNMWLYEDAEFLRQVAEARSKGQDVAGLGLKPDLMKRGAIRSITDGRYRFSRYFSPMEHNLPETVEEMFQHNDVELFDLESDPDEMHNLALEPGANADLLLAMNQKLTDIIAREVGSDEGEFLPENEAGWTITHIDP